MITLELTIVAPSGGVKVNVACINIVEEIRVKLKVI